MPNHLSPVLFMLLSTFSLSLTGLLSKYLAQIMPIAYLGFLRFIIPALFFIHRHEIDLFSLASTLYAFSFTDPFDLHSR